MVDRVIPFFYTKDLRETRKLLKRRSRVIGPPLARQKGVWGGPGSDCDNPQHSRTRTFCDFADEFVFWKSSAEVVSGSLPL